MLKGEEVPIHVKVTVKSGNMVIDLSKCSAERKAAINSRTYAGARVAYKALTGPLDPVNEGSFRALEVIIPEGNIMMARFPAPMAGWSGIVPTVVDCIVGALAKAMPDRVPAGHHALLGGAVVFFGTHPKTKRRFVVQSIEGGGWGGRPFEDGESGTVSVCQGDVRNGSIEGIELKCPVVVESRELRPDSCGAGKYRGGLGIDMRVKNLVEGKWNFEMPRRSKRPPWGIRGGTPGEPGGYLLKLPGEKTFTMMGGSHIPVADRRRGDRADRRRRRLGPAARPPGGGGGARMSPRASSRRRRRRSSMAWRCGATCSLDEAATAKLRKQVKSAPKSPSRKKRR